MYLKTPPINLCAFSLSRMLSFYHLSCLIKRHSIHCLRSVPSPPLLCTPTPPLASAHPTYWAALRRLAGSPSAPRPGDRIPMSPHTRSVRPLTPIFFLLPQWLQTYQLARTPLYKTSSRWRPHQPTTSPAARPLGFLPEKEWDPVLKILPDPQLAAFLRRGIRDGFRLGVSPSATLVSSNSNSPSALALASKVDEYIEEEVKAGNLAPSPREGVHLSPIGFIPKKNRPGKFRLIVNLSFPSGHSINDAISPAHSSFRYVTVRQVTELIPQGSSLAKIDLKAAFRRVPVHPADQHYLGISWRDRTLCDRALPFGLRSAPIIFNAVADGLAWAMICSNVVDLAHYLDNFIFWSADHATCQQTLDLAIRTATRLGLPVEPAKVEGPSTTLTFLCIEIDTVSMELRLPQTKLARLKSTLAEWCNKKSASKHDLQVVIGLLCDAAQVVPAGRPFIRSLINAMSRLKAANHLTRLDQRCKADLAWWHTYIEAWNEAGLFHRLPDGPSITADASGSWGAGAFISLDHAWFQIQWPDSWSATNIAAKELLPIVVALAIWGHRCAVTRVTLYSDNYAVVQCLETRSAKDPNLAHLLRFFLAHHNISYRVFHVAGKNNRAADALSRNELWIYSHLFPQAPKSPCHVPSPLLSLLLDDTITWTSDRWRDSFRACTRKA